MFYRGGFTVISLVLVSSPHAAVAVSPLSPASSPCPECFYPADPNFGSKCFAIRTINPIRLNRIQPGYASKNASQFVPMNGLLVYQGSVG